MCVATQKRLRTTALDLDPSNSSHTSKYIFSLSQNQEPVKISENQLNVFREVVDVTPDAEDLESESDNFRALQPLNERKLLEVYTGIR